MLHILESFESFFLFEQISFLTFLFYFEHFFFSTLLRMDVRKSGPNPCKFDLGSLLLRLFDTYMSIIKLLHNGAQIFSKSHLYSEIVYHTRAIITHGLYIFTPIFSAVYNQENVGLKSVVYNQERVIMAGVRYMKLYKSQDEIKELRAKDLEEARKTKPKKKEAVIFFGMAPENNYYLIIYNY